MRCSFSILVCLAFLCAKPNTGIAATNLVPVSLPEQMFQERGHFLRCLAAVYDPSMWLSYDGGLYFFPHTDAQFENLQAMKEARDNYVALTNRLTRYALASAALARSGLSNVWQQKLLLPYSNTNQDLTPTRQLNVRLLPQYEVVTNFGGGDVLLTAEEDVFFVMGFGRSADDAFRTNAVLVREGTKSFKSPTGDYVQAEAFTNAALSKEEIAVFRQAAKAFLSEALFPSANNTVPAAVALVQPRPEPKLRPTVRARQPENSAVEEEFKIHLVRAKDSSPYIQFLLARDYLEGLGTAKNEELGMEWMERAAKNGSGDAKAYLAAQKQKSP